MQGFTWFLHWVGVRDLASTGRLPIQEGPFGVCWWDVTMLGPGLCPLEALLCLVAPGTICWVLPGVGAV